MPSANVTTRGVFATGGGVGWCWTAFQLDDGSKWHAVVPDDSPLSIGYAQLPDGTSEGVADATVDVAAGPEGIPIGAELSIGSNGVHGRSRGLGARSC